MRRMLLLFLIITMIFAVGYQKYETKIEAYIRNNDSNNSLFDEFELIALIIEADSESINFEFDQDSMMVDLDLNITT